MDITQIIANDLREYFKDKPNECLTCSIILSELLKRYDVNNKIIEGYFETHDGKCGRHYWVVVKGKIIDISTDVILRKIYSDYGINYPRPKCVTSIKDGCITSNERDVESLEKIYKHYKRTDFNNFLKEQKPLLNSYIKILNIIENQRKNNNFLTN
jgi:hypothetical protein